MVECNRQIIQRISHMGQERCCQVSTGELVHLEQVRVPSSLGKAQYLNKHQNFLWSSHIVLIIILDNRRATLNTGLLFFLSIVDNKPGTLWSNILPLEESKRAPYMEVAFFCLMCEVTHSTKILFVWSL